MAHECPTCGMTCYCNGDIDDCCFNFEEYVNKCVHWKKCDPEIDEDEEFEDNWDGDMFEDMNK